MKILFIAPWYLYRPILPASLLLQTHADWRLLLIHDGPLLEEVRQFVPADPRIEVTARAHRANDWGHTLRDEALDRITADRIACDAICVTNADNYYVPGFCVQMLAALGGAAAAYCDCVHSHRGWTLMPAALELRSIDCGSLLVQADLALATPWRGRGFCADWEWIAELLAAAGPGRFVHVPRPLFVHN